MRDQVTAIGKVRETAPGDKERPLLDAAGNEVGRLYFISRDHGWYYPGGSNHFLTMADACEYFGGAKLIRR